MNKTWNVTLYRDGEPVSERHGVSHSDAVAQIYRLSRTNAPLAAVDDSITPDTREQKLLAAA
jgi:hypothetical protein